MKNLIQSRQVPISTRRFFSPYMREPVRNGEYSFSCRLSSGCTGRDGKCFIWLEMSTYFTPYLVFITNRIRRCCRFNLLIYWYIGKLKNLLLSIVQIWNIHIDASAYNRIVIKNNEYYYLRKSMMVVLRLMCRWIHIMYYTTFLCTLYRL